MNPPIFEDYQQQQRQEREREQATNPTNYFAQSPLVGTGNAPGTVGIGSQFTPLTSTYNTQKTIAANSNLSPGMLGGRENAGVMTDRLGNKIIAPATPLMFAEGGEVEADDSPINTDPLGSAQQMMAQLSQADRPSPTRQSVKRVAKSTGGKEMPKEMGMNAGSLTTARDLMPAPSDKGSSRQQMEDFIRVYQNKLSAAKDKARGMSSDTFGAPTLEGASLAKNTLAKKRFAKGGEAKKSEGDDVPQVTGVNKVLDFIAQRVPGSVVSALPTSARTLLETAQGTKTPVTEANFSPKEMAIMRQLAEFKGGDKGSISYADYAALAEQLNKKGGEYSSSVPSLFSMGDPMGNVQTTLGQFRYMKDPQGNLQVMDKYDFNPPNPNVTQEARTGDYGGFGPYNLIRDYAGEKIPPGKGREVRINLGPVKKRAEGSPEEGELSQAEIDAASRPAFVSPSMRPATKISRANDPTDRILGAIEPAVTLGTGAVAAAVGMPRGIYKGLTSGQVGQGKAASIASKEAADFIERNTYVPRSESGRENLAALGKIAQDLKLAPTPGGAAMASLARPAAVRAQGANIADDFQQYNRQLAVPGASYAVPPQGPTKIPAPASGLGFYSAAEQAALNLPRKEGSGAAFLNDLMKAPDVKKEELSAMGLDEFLKGKPKATRQEVQDFIANNRIDVKEVQLGGNVVEDPAGVAKRKAVFDKYEPEISSLYKQMDAAPQDQPDLWNQLHGKATEIQRIRDREADAAYVIPEPLPTRFDRPSLVLPGGENYREILLTTPGKKPAPVTSADDPRVKILGSEGEGWSVLVNGENVQGYRRGTRKSEVMDYAIADANSAIEQLAKKNQYKSSHFDEPNILAHMRVNDRVDADGKKMLLIEELQSDWHQEGRQKGYRGNEQKTPYDDPAWVQARRRATELLNEFNMNNTRPDRQAEIYPMLQEADRIESSFVNRNNQIGSRVPDAPFKDTWHQLALKRALKYAADNGYERVGLTTGKQQAQRYDLSKQVEGVRFIKHGEDKYTAYAISDGRSVGEVERSGLNKISEMFGRDIAEKIKNSEESEGTLRGVDLQVGGEGMRKYYDEIYPAFLAKQAKKYGAQVGETTIATGRVRDAQGIPAMYPTKEPVRYIDIAPGMQDAVPYAKGGAVDKNTAFIKAHS